MVFGKFVSGTEEMLQVRKIQREVFEQECGLLPQDKSESEEFCVCALAFDGETPVGTGQILFDGTQFTISGVAVLKDYRGQKYGDFLVRLLVDKAMMSNAQAVYLDALSGTEDFFRTIGFEVCGESYKKAGGSWSPMILHTDQIHKCCGCGK